MTRSELAALPTIDLATVNDRTGTRFGPDAQAGWLVAVNSEGKPVMCCATTGKGSRYVMGMLMMNAEGNNFKLYRAV